MKKAFLRNYPLKLNPSEKAEFPLRGQVVRVISAGCTVYFETGDGSSAFYLVEGEEARFPDGAFFDLNVFHLEATEQTVILALSENASIGSAKVSGNVVITSYKNNGSATQGRASLTNVNQQLLAANADRRYLLIQNNDASQYMRVNIAGVAATVAQGFRVPPGGVLELPNFQATQAINAIMENATATAGNVEFAEG